MSTQPEDRITQLEQQLAAERENVILATQMVHIESKRANTAERTLEAAYEKNISNLNRVETDYLRELDVKLDQINAQMAYDKRRVERHGGFPLKALQIIDAALSKLGYPLPAGRTK